MKIIIDFGITDEQRNDPEFMKHFYAHLRYHLDSRTLNLPNLKGNMSMIYYPNGHAEYVDLFFEIDNAVVV